MKEELHPIQYQDLIELLKARFRKNMLRHKNLKWSHVEEKLLTNTNKLWSINEMEKTGVEPDVICLNLNADEFTFIDCSAESPQGRRNTCYDRKGQDSRKEHKPENNAIDMASAIGIEILTEQQYRELQQHGNFDLKTSSWIDTPEDIRKLGGALFADCRFGHVFIYHNGAQSYNGVRGFRGLVRV